MSPAHMRAHKCTPTCTLTYPHAHLHTHMHTYTPTYTCTNTQMHTTPYAHTTIELSIPEHFWMMLDYLKILYINYDVVICPDYTVS